MVVEQIDREHHFKEHKRVFWYHVWQFTRIFFIFITMLFNSCSQVMIPVLEYLHHLWRPDARIGQTVDWELCRQCRFPWDGRTTRKRAFVNGFPLSCITRRGYDTWTEETWPCAEKCYCLAKRQPGQARQNFLATWRQQSADSPYSHGRAEEELCKWLPVVLYYELRVWQNRGYVIVCRSGKIKLWAVEQ